MTASDVRDGVVFRTASGNEWRIVQVRSARVVLVERVGHDDELYTWPVDSLMVDGVVTYRPYEA